MAGLRGKALVAYLLVCTVWGSTYLFIRIGVAHLPPFLFAGVRFLIAGLLLGAIVLALGIRLPTRPRDWRTLALTGVLFLCGANALVVWAEQFLASGIASVFVAAMPLWTALFDSIVPGGKTPLTWRVGIGLAIGFAGTALLAGITPQEIATAELRGPLALTFGSACWALGSVYWKRHPTETSPYSAAAVQMTIAGGLLCVFGLLLGEAPAWHLEGAGLGAMVYLVLVGSLVGYTAYGYALEHASATVVGTYAYINPVVAVVLGWAVLHEPVTGRMLAAMALILGAVIWIQLASRPATAGSRAPVRALRRRHPADA
ncbi:MAG TPA: EamA family transporter [Gemmatimonadales bacterium]|nr:EamA family transporter [Gemmatimonadales bacterium]